MRGPSVVTPVSAGKNGRPHGSVYRFIGVWQQESSQRPQWLNGATVRASGVIPHTPSLWGMDTARRGQRPKCSLGQIQSQQNALGGGQRSGAALVESPQRRSSLGLDPTLLSAVASHRVGRVLPHKIPHPSRPFSCQQLRCPPSARPVVWSISTLLRPTVTPPSSRWVGVQTVSHSLHLIRRCPFGHQVLGHGRAPLVVAARWVIPRRRKHRARRRRGAWGRSRNTVLPHRGEQDEGERHRYRVFAATKISASC